LLSAAVLVFVCWAFSVRSPAAVDVSSHQNLGTPKSFTVQGVDSCAATACHGDSGSRGSKRSEYTTWFTYDKHQKAFAVLLTDRSRLIETNYRRLAEQRDAHPENDATCLKCHAEVAESRRLKRSLADGVACESCHGAAEKWLTVHYLAGFKEKTDREKHEQYGMQPTKNLLYRAQMCADCHVGSPGKQVNHDLYAAAHPPLHFEFAAYSALMPKHWNEAEEKARQPDLEVRSWAIGQTVSARAALGLLAWRAENDSQPWPEFAEYGCYSCHHDLQASSRRQASDHYAGRTLGSLPWGDWFTAELLLSLDGMPQSMDLANLKRGLTGLKEAMGKPVPQRKDVAQRAQSVLRLLEPTANKLERATFDGGRIDQMLRSIRAREPTQDPANWDEQAQSCLALSALYHGLGDLQPGHQDPKLKGELEKKRKQLLVPSGFDSPRGFDAAFGRDR
jgi:hypothetical protein